MVNQQSTQSLRRMDGRRYSSTRLKFEKLSQWKKVRRECKCGIDIYDTYT
jgi:hypothetical protein